MRRSEVTATNREGWNEAAPLHAKHNLEALLAAFRTPGHSCLDDIESARFEALGVVGKDVIQLCCNNGRELVSVKNIGAARCVGVDISDGFIAQAREITTAAGVDCSFIRSDIHDIPAAYDDAFDIVYITIGALCWMPSLDPFFAVVARLLRPGGCVFLYEVHPILGMFDPNDDVDPPVWHHSYFKRDAFIDTDGLDYYGGTTYESKPLITFQQPLSEIFMAAIDNGLAIEHFAEFGHDIAMSFAHLERMAARLPLSYTLVARKTK